MYSFKHSSLNLKLYHKFKSGTWSAMHQPKYSNSASWVVHDNPTKKQNNPISFYLAFHLTRKKKKKNLSLNIQHYGKSKNKLIRRNQVRNDCLLKGREFSSPVKETKTWGKSMTTMWYITSAFLIPLAVFPLLKMVITFWSTLIQLALQNPSEDKAATALYAVQQTEVNLWWIIEGWPQTHAVSQPSYLSLSGI